jgi:hypothetical protein
MYAVMSRRPTVSQKHTTKEARIVITAEEIGFYCLPKHIILFLVIVFIVVAS